jgi:endonuclease/exonuclease/phosphatase family metal-dependent hydrolase
MDVTVGTFNLNNLFDRFNFQAEIRALPSSQREVRTTYQWEFEGSEIDANVSTGSVVRIQRNANGALLDAKSPEGQQAIATRIAAMDVDVLCVQEVENLDALRRFNRDMLPRHYEYEVLVEGNDPRFIDIAVLSRLPVANITSHRFEIHPDDGRPVFGRDLLEVDVLTAARSRRLFKVFVNHLKSNYVPYGVADVDAARNANNRRRQRQAEIVARVVAARTRPRTAYLVVGDMNDAPDSGPLEPMVTGLGLEDALAGVVENRPAPASRNPEDAPVDARWTHRFSVSRGPDKFELFDQIWASPGLADHVAHAEIDRRLRWSGESADVGSDHDPAWIRLTGL